MTSQTSIQNLKSKIYFTAPAVMPRMSWREKMTYKIKMGIMAKLKDDKTAFQSLTNCPKHC
jgi:hypothetical protein